MGTARLPDLRAGARARVRPVPRGARRGARADPRRRARLCGGGRAAPGAAPARPGRAYAGRHEDGRALPVLPEGALPARRARLGGAPMSLRSRIGGLVRGATPDAEIAPRELGGMRLVVPRGYAGVYGDGYEPAVAGALERLVGPGDVCADVGAHVGFFAMLMASRSGPEGRVLVFEASEENAGYIRRSIELNKDGARIELRNAAITDGATDSIELYPGRGGGE